MKLKPGDRVEVPAHRKPRGQKRRYHVGTVEEVTARNIVAVTLDNGTRVIAPLGIVQRIA